MKAVGLYEYLAISDPRALLDLDVPKPNAPTGHDLLIQIEAISVNPVDIKVRSQQAKPENTPRILGWDASGTVIAVGDEVGLFQAGDKVFYAGDITRPGSNAQYQLVDERIVGLAPKSLTPVESAALPLTSITAYEILFDRFGICKNEGDAGKSILIIGAAGGVGSIAIQLAKQIAKLNVIATASRPESVNWVSSLGADYVINHYEDLSTQLQRTPYPQVHYVMILSGNDAYITQMANFIAPFGKIASITETSKPQNWDALKTKSVSFSWEFMFTRPMFKTPDMIAQHYLLNEVAMAVDSGVLRTTLTQNLGIINAANLRHAHQLIESGRTVGKIALSGF